MSDTATKSNENEKLSSALNEIFSNPQMLAAISSMAQSLKNNEASPSSEHPKSNETEEKQNNTTAAITDKLPELLNMLSSNNPSSVKQNRRSELLCALKPYLSQSRSDAIDKIIRFSELSSVFKNLT